MAIDKKLIKYATKARFTADLGNSLIPTTSIVFIQDTGELWTHGIFFGGHFSSVDSNYGTLTLGGSSVNLSLYGHKHSYTDLLGSTTTANQVIVSNGTANGWILKTLGSGAFDSTSYLPLTGGTLTGALITNSNVLGWVFRNEPKAWYGSISYDSSGGECLGIMFKNSSTKFKVKAGYDSSSFAGNNAYTSMTNADLEVGAGYAKINNNTIWHAGNLNPNSYLLLSGGTTTGGVGIDSNFNLTLGAAGNTWNIFTSGAVGTDSPTFMVGHNSGIIYMGNKIWHAGNDGDGSGLDADMLDGLHSTSMFQNKGILDSVDLNTLMDVGNYWINSNVSNRPCNYGALLVVGQNDTRSQLALGYAGGIGMWYRGSGGALSTTGWSGWKTIAFTDSHVASSSNSDLLDGYNESAFLRYRTATSTDQESTLWDQIGIKQYNGARPDGLTEANYNWGAVISLPSLDARLDIFYAHLSTNPSRNTGLWVKTGWGTDKTSVWRRLAYTIDNVASATKLETSRSFTIGNTAKSFDGTDNVSWSLSEIGAAAAIHSHTISQITDIANASVSYAVSAGNASTLGGLSLNSTANTNANEVVRTDGSGYIQCGYINSASGGGEKNASSPPYVWGTNGTDNFLRTYETSCLSVAYAANAGAIGGYTTANIMFKAGGTFSGDVNFGTSSYHINTSGSATFGNTYCSYLSCSGDMFVNNSITTNGINRDVTVIHSNVTLSPFYHIIYTNNIQAEITLYLPSSPTDGQEFIIKKHSGAKNITIHGNGHNLWWAKNNSASLYVQDERTYTVVYSSGLAKWGMTISDA